MKTQQELKIFCVDDEPYTLNLSKGVLENMGYHNVSIFETGEDCLAHLTEDPDVVFLDYNMSSMNGLQVLREIKKRNPEIYVVMLSAQESQAITEATLEYGAFTYLKKEGNLHEMLETIMEKVGPRIWSIQQFLHLTANKGKPQSFMRN